MMRQAHKLTPPRVKPKPAVSALQWNHEQEESEPALLHTCVSQGISVQNLQEKAASVRVSWEQVWDKPEEEVFHTMQAVELVTTWAQNGIKHFHRVTAY